MNQDEQIQVEDLLQQLPWRQPTQTLDQAVYEITAAATHRPASSLAAGFGWTSLAAAVLISAAVGLAAGVSVSAGDSVRSPLEGPSGAGQRIEVRHASLIQSIPVFTINGESSGRARLGVHVALASPVLQKQLKLPEGIGLVVEKVVRQSAAERSGLQVSDVLHKLEDQLLVSHEQLGLLVNHYGVGEKVTFTVIREGAPILIETVLGAGEERAKIAGFDAFDYYHGHEGYAELQNCAICHQTPEQGAAEGDESQPFDNYELFHGKPGTAHQQICSDCHTREVRPLELRSVL